MNKKDFGYNTDCCCLTDREINQILMKENQALKDRWKKLKEYMLSEHNWGLENDYQDCSYGIRLILDKMQELEKGETE